MNLVETQVVSAPLQQREFRPAGEQLGKRVGQPRQVAIDELALQRDGRGRDDHGFVGGDGACDRRYQVGQRLAGPGAGLHREVFTGVEGGRDRLGHLDLAAALGAAQCRDRLGQQVGDRS